MFQLKRFELLGIRTASHKRNMRYMRPDDTFLHKLNTTPIFSSRDLVAS